MEDENTRTASSHPADKAELINRIQDEWMALMLAIETFTPEQMSAPIDGGWSVKDHLAHLAAWEVYLLDHYLGGQAPQEVMQVDATTFEQLDEDGLNAIIYARYKDRPSKEVLKALKHSHEEVLNTLEGIQFAELLEPLYAGDPKNDPKLIRVINNTYGHYQEHRRTIQATIDD